MNEATSSDSESRINGIGVDSVTPRCQVQWKPAASDVNDPTPPPLLIPINRNPTPSATTPLGAAATSYPAPGGGRSVGEVPSQPATLNYTSSSASFTSSTSTTTSSSSTSNLSRVSPKRILQALKIIKPCDNKFKWVSTSFPASNIPFDIPIHIFLLVILRHLISHHRICQFSSSLSIFINNCYTTLYTYYIVN